ncbi:hypothetical protein BV20DRAFT_133451 [Pilatotrama ljubarskyi]|nr:hypothetical protein BV20DRAFT_133451 [Pilatotrama ljubarskyi]
MSQDSLKHLMSRSRTPGLASRTCAGIMSCVLGSSSSCIQFAFPAHQHSRYGPLYSRKTRRIHLQPWTLHLRAVILARGASRVCHATQSRVVETVEGSFASED